MGDDIQSLKAGIMEIAHVFAINKSDRPGADRMQAEVEQVLGLQDWTGRWCPRIVRTVATRGEGIDELCQSLAAHRHDGGGEAGTGRRRRELSRTRFMSLLSDHLLAELMRRLGDDAVDAQVEAIARREVDPYSATLQAMRDAGMGNP